jgi:hypothetical protein
MTAEMPTDEAVVELDRCIDQLLTTGAWEVRMAPGTGRPEVDGLMRVAALLRTLIGHIAHPRPSEKDRVWASVSDSLQLWSVVLARHCGRVDRSPRFGPI